MEMHSPKNNSVEILLVEDNLADIRFTFEALKESNLVNNISVVSNGVEAISFLKREGKYTDSPQPDFILLDIDLPKKNGHEVLENIRSDIKLKNIPVAVLTSSKDIYDISRAYKNHVNGYIVKKPNLKELSHDIECFYGFSLLTHRNNKRKKNI